MHITALTHIGHVRSENQDKYCVHKYNTDECLVVVADGMGGHKFGSIASNIVIDKIAEYMKNQRQSYENFKNNISQALVNGIDIANNAILEWADRHDVDNGMGSTVVVCYVHKNIVYIAYVGDSRAYLIRNKDIIRLTRDHSITQLINSFELDRVCNENKNINKNMITKAVGMEKNSKFIGDSVCIDYKPNDNILMCTDGLTNELDDSEILEVILKERFIVNKLIDKANDRNSSDNITAVLIKL